MNPRRSYRPGPNYGLIAVIAIAVVVVVFLIGTIANATYFKQHTVIATVCSKDRGGNNGSYRVYTQGAGALAVKDIHWIGHWRTNSADVYGGLATRATYRITYLGFRSGFLSVFPNVVGYQRVATNEQQLANC